MLVIEGKVSEDNFSGGLRIIADKVYELGEARSRYARSLSLQLAGKVDVSKLKAQLHPFRSEDAGARYASTTITAPPARPDAAAPGACGWTTACCCPCRIGWAQTRLRSCGKPP